MIEDGPVEQPIAPEGVEQVDAEQRAFRIRVLNVAGGLLTLLGPIFAFSEWSDQTLFHNFAVLSLLPVGLGMLLMVAQDRLQVAVLLLTVGVLPVVAWVHVFGERGQMGVMYLVPALVVAMVASKASTRVWIPVVVVTSAAGMRIARWAFQSDTDWATWTTHSFDAVAILAITGVLVQIGLRRMQLDQVILEQAITEGRRHMDQARKASDAKSTFLARVSHELRTPLNAILGYTELIQEEDGIQPDNVDDLERIHASATHLLGLVDNVLDLSRVEAGRMKLELTLVELDPMLARLRSTIEPLVRHHENELIVVREGEPTAWLDEQRTVQVLLNLLSNAARYTERGTVRLEVRAAADTVSFRVLDTGIGIAAERLPSLFEPFLQANHQGTGIGLALCDRFVRHLGGHIEVESTVGEGSCFVVTLPNVQPSPAVTPA